MEAAVTTAACFRHALGARSLSLELLIAKVSQRDTNTSGQYDLSKSVIAVLCVAEEFVYAN